MTIAFIIFNWNKRPRRGRIFVAYVGLMINDPGGVAPPYRYAAISADPIAKTNQPEIRFRNYMVMSLPATPP